MSSSALSQPWEASGKHATGAEAARSSPLSDRIVSEPREWRSDLPFGFADHFPGFLTPQLVPCPFNKPVANY